MTANHNGTPEPDDDASALKPEQQAFLAAYAEVGIAKLAAAASGVTLRRHNRWLKTDDAYREAFEESRLAASDTLEAEARRRAVDGVRRLKFDRSGRPMIDPETGQPYVEHRYSDTLLVFLLKANNPAKFGDKVEQTHKGSLASSVKVYPAGEDPDAMTTFYLPDNGRGLAFAAGSN